MFSVQSNLGLVPSSDLTYSFDGTIQVQMIPDTSVLIIDGTYKLKVFALDDNATPDDSGEPPGEEVLFLNFKLAANFSVEAPGSEPNKFSNDELDSFGETTGRLALHPYARAFVADITGRMGLPSLHIATLKLPIDRPNMEPAS